MTRFRPPGALRSHRRRIHVELPVIEEPSAIGDKPTRTWPPAGWTFVEPDEEAIRALVKPPEITPEIRAWGTDYAVKRRANRFAQDNGKPLPFPDIEAELQQYMPYILGKDGLK